MARPAGRRTTAHRDGGGTEELASGHGLRKAVPRRCAPSGHVHWVCWDELVGGFILLRFCVSVMFAWPVSGGVPGTGHWRNVLVRTS